MDENELTPEEKEEEQKALEEVKDEELREKIAEDLGIDPDDEAELLDKLVERDKANHAKLSGAIKQKISWREKATKTSKENPDDKSKKDEKKPSENGLTEEDVDRRVNEKLEARDLAELDIPNDEIKDEVKELAKLRGITVREAYNAPYIQNRIQEAKKEAEVADATPSRKKKGSTAKVDATKPLNPADYDFSTEEGREAWNNAKAARAEHLKNNK